MQVVQHVKYLILSVTVDSNLTNISKTIKHKSSQSRFIRGKNIVILCINWRFLVSYMYI